MSLSAQIDISLFGILPGDKLAAIRAKAELYFANHPDSDLEKPFERWFKDATRWADGPGNLASDQSMLLACVQHQAMTSFLPLLIPQPEWEHPDLHPRGLGETDRITGCGRANLVRFHPGNPNHVYAGMAGGGIFQSTDGGDSWLPLTDHNYVFPTLEIRDLAFNPAGTALYALVAGRNELGVGVSSLHKSLYRSTNGGSAWSEIVIDSFAPVDLGIYWHRMAIDPNNPGSIMIAGAKKGSNTQAGIYITNDGGSSWSPYVTNVNAFDIEVKAEQDYTHVYMTWVDGQNINLRYWKRLAMPDGNGGLVSATIINQVWTWNFASTLKPHHAQVTATNGGTVYFMMDVTDQSGQHQLQFLKAGGFGLQPVPISPQTPPTRTSGAVIGPREQTFEVAPNHPDHLYIGNLPLYRSTNGGHTWENLQEYFPAGQLHNDNNQVEFLPGAYPLVAFVSNDAGIFKVTDVPGSQQMDWSLDFLTDGLNALEVNHLGLSKENPEVLSIGSHDNSTEVWHFDQGNRQRISTGDGQETNVHPTNPNLAVLSDQYGSLWKTTDGYETGRAFLGNIISQSPKWDTPFMFDPSNPTLMLCVTDRFLQSTDNGDNWTQVSSTAFAPGNMSTFTVSPDRQYCYAAFQNRFYYSTDSGVNWQQGTDTGSKLGNSILDLEVDPSDPTVVVAAMGGTSNERILRSTDFGTTWTGVGQDLPSVPINSLAIDPRRPREAYACSDYGVYYCPDYPGGADWLKYDNERPNVPGMELEISDPEQMLYAATRGRGIGRIPLAHTYDAEPYCTPVGTALDHGVGITRLKLVRVSNSNVVVDYISGTNEDYTLHDALPSSLDVLLRGKTYRLEYEIAPHASTARDLVVWLDYDESGSFSGTPLQQVSMPSGSTTGNVTFTVPSSGVGKARLRVGVELSGSQGLPACGPSSNGEYEDIRIKVTGLPGGN